MVSMCHMLMWVVRFTAVWAHNGIQLSDTAVALQAARDANRRVIMAYESILPSEVAASLIMQHKSLASSFEDVPELWLPADKLQSCLQSYVMRLDIDLIPSWKRGGLEDELRDDMKNASAKCAAPWNEAKKSVVRQLHGPSPSPPPSVSWLCWLPFVCLVVYLGSRQKRGHAVQSSDDAHSNGAEHAQAATSTVEDLQIGDVRRRVHKQERSKSPQRFENHAPTNTEGSVFKDESNRVKKKGKRTERSHKFPCHQNSLVVNPSGWASPIQEHSEKPDSNEAVGCLPGQ